MRILAKSLFLLSMLVSLTLSNAMARSHEVTCDSSEECIESSCADNNDSHPCHDCPPPPPSPCDHGHDHDHHHDFPEEPAPAHDHEDHEDHDCPSPDHKHHHHHHQCICSGATAWLISGSEPFSLHPPHPGDTGPAVEFLFAPESPASVLDRPPIA